MIHRIVPNVTFDGTSIIPPVTLEKENILQLGKGGLDDPSRGTPPALVFSYILVEIGSVSEHPPEALVAAIRSGSSLRFGCTDRELWSSNLSPV